jgi:fused signal recognition particle receptor
MFGKLKEKLKGWFKKSEEQAEQAESEQVAEEVEKTVKPKAEPKTKEEKKSLIGRIKSRFKFKVTEKYFDEIFSELEMIMLENNIALEVVEKVKTDLKKELLDVEIRKEQVEKELKQALKISLESLFTEELDLIKKIKQSEGTFVIVFFGINGSGKTTTVAKLANLLQKNNISCVLAAADTFRAASIEQLQKHADKLKMKMIKHDYGADPAAVAFDAIKHAKSNNIKAVLIDTAGRMHTKADLMREMEKIVRVAKPDLKIFIGESITGNDATEQAKKFNESVGIDAIILSKADVDEKGGTAISVSHVTGSPIIYLGTGQEYKDLEPFDKNKIINALF